MSELRESASRRQRADARRSVVAILDAAIDLLGRRPAASMDEVAAAAGVSRQTIYAHYPSRDALLTAVTDRITVDVMTAIDAMDLDRGPATEALRRWLDGSWGLIERYPVLLTPAVATAAADEDEAHQPITDRLARLIRRGQHDGEFDRSTSTGWLVAAIFGLGHAAGHEVGAGRMSSADAGRAFRESVLRLCEVGRARR